MAASGKYAPVEDGRDAVVFVVVLAALAVVGWVLLRRRGGG
ncbi:MULTISPECIES: hypothetical protein [unclassified Streptomyces]